MTAPAAKHPYHKYWRGQVGPRASRILWSRQVLIAILVGLAGAVYAGRLHRNALKVSDLAIAGLAFAAISFGACITGAVLSLTLPAEERVTQLATSRLDESPFSHYSDLVFAFTWSAVVQLTLIVTILLFYLLDSGGAIWVRHPTLWRRIAIGACSFAGTYAMLRLFNVVYTISQLAAVLISEAEKSQAKRTDQ